MKRNSTRVANYPCSSVLEKLSLSDLSQWQLKSCALSYSRKYIVLPGNQQQGGASLIASFLLHLGDRMFSTRALVQGCQQSIDVLD
jgi:hypothetical protein